eukprot:5469699-Alexandrium_andersonii.AAC.1
MEWCVRSGSVVTSREFCLELRTLDARVIRLIGRARWSRSLVVNSLRRIVYPEGADIPLADDYPPLDDGEPDDPSEPETEVSDRSDMFELSDAEAGKDRAELKG